jgi:predicted SAM-dependent methyltransferase
MAGKRANFGCGIHPLEGWLNFDASPAVRLRQLVGALSAVGLAGADAVRLARVAREKNIVYADVTKGLALADESLDVVYCSHMIEHLGPKEAERFAKETLRLLRPGGIFRLALPDLSQNMEVYRKEGAAAFMQTLNTYNPGMYTPLGKLRFVLFDDRNHHRWLYDADSMTQMLRGAGFRTADRLPPGETSIPDPGPLDLREREAESMYIEARK